MTFSQLLTHYIDSLRAGNPKAIALLVVIILCLFMLLFGPHALLVWLKILMPFWLTAVVYAACYSLMQLYKKRHPDFTADVFATIVLTALIMLLVIFLLRI